MKILVTGTEGYLGSLLAPLLVASGHDVTGVDTGYYADGQLFHAPGPRPRTLVRDIRHLDGADLEDVDAVVHMAELSNDPAGALSPRMTFEINHAASVRLASLAREAGVRRFIYMSSCSVYGIVEGTAPVTEESPVNPQTAYAECKVLCERDIKPLAARGFSPIFLRNATAFGASPRQRFDLVVNNLCGLAWATGKIAMTSDGSPWRPLVHGLDICRAIRCALEAPQEAVHGQVFNVGSDEQNHRVRDVAGIVGKVFTDCDITFGDSGDDRRSYRVRFDKIRRHMPDFHCEWDVLRGARQMHQVFQSIDMKKDLFEFRAFTRLKQLQYLIRTGQLDAHFFWRGGLEGEDELEQARAGKTQRQLAETL